MPPPGDWVSYENARPIEGTRFRLCEVTEIDSTNRALIDANVRGEPAGLALITGHQTHGRGRRNRTWDAPPGSGLMMSVLLEPPVDTASVHLLATAVGLSAVEACRSFGARAQLKWPNDVVITGPDGSMAKLAGVLAESVVLGEAVSAAVVGIGLNLRPVPGRDAALGRSIAVLDSMTPTRIEPRELGLVILNQLERHVQLVYDDPATLRATAIGESALIGRRVRVELDGETLVGVAVDVDVAGCLVVESAGRRRTLTVGDVVHAAVD